MSINWGMDKEDMAYMYNGIFSSVQSLSCVQLCNPMNCSMPGLPVHHQLPEFIQLMSIESVMPSSHLILCRPLLLLPSIFPSIKVLSSEWVLHITWPKYWSFSFSISPSNEYSNGILLSHIKEWTNASNIAATLIVILSEVSQDKDKYCMMPIICTILKNGTNELIYKTDTESQM